MTDAKQAEQQAQIRAMAAELRRLRGKPMIPAGPAEVIEFQPPVR